MSRRFPGAGWTSRTVIGLFDGRDAAQNAIRALRAAGFSDQDIRVVVGDPGGGVIGELVGMGVTSDDARHFDRGFRAGGILVSVTTRGERADTAVRIMDRHGADLGPSRTPYAARDVPGVGATDVETLGGELTGDVRFSWTGMERRYHADAAYAGPERRTVRA